jgi:hypothetical protein
MDLLTSDVDIASPAEESDVDFSELGDISPKICSRLTVHFK